MKKNIFIAILVLLILITLVACACALKKKVPKKESKGRACQNRSDVTQGLLPGEIPVVLDLCVKNKKDYEPYEGVLIELFSLDASGSIPTDDRLRGSQMTDSNGRVIFKTIFPGWHHGRTIHYHVNVTTFDVNKKVQSIRQTELFIEQPIINMIYRSMLLYSSRGLPDTINSVDPIYTKTQELDMEGNPTLGYSSFFTLYLPLD